MNDAKMNRGQGRGKATLKMFLLGNQKGIEGDKVFDTHYKTPCLGTYKNSRAQTSQIQGARSENQKEGKKT